MFFPPGFWNPCIYRWPPPWWKGLAYHRVHGFGLYVVSRWPVWHASVWHLVYRNVRVLISSDFRVLDYMHTLCLSLVILLDHTACREANWETLHILWTQNKRAYNEILSNLRIKIGSKLRPWIADRCGGMIESQQVLWTHKNAKKVVLVKRFSCKWARSAPSIVHVYRLTVKYVCSYIYMCVCLFLNIYKFLGCY